MEEHNQPLPCPIAGEPAEVEASQNARPGQPMTYMVPALTTLEAIEQAQSRMDRLYVNATGIVDSCARGVMETCASDVMTSLRAAHDAQTRDIMATRAMLTFALSDYADVEDGWASAAADLAHAMHNAMKQLDAMLGLYDANEGLTYEDFC